MLLLLLLCCVTAVALLEAEVSVPETGLPVAYVLAAAVVLAVAGTSGQKHRVCGRAPTSDAAWVEALSNM